MCAMEEQANILPGMPGFINCELSDVLESPCCAMLSDSIRHRAAYDAARCEIEWQCETPEQPIKFVFDFGFRIKVIRSRADKFGGRGSIRSLVKYILGKLRFSDTNNNYDDMSFIRQRFKEHPMDLDLDREADALNVAMFWSDFVMGESSALTAVRGDLCNAILDPGGISATGLITRISQLESVPVKRLFLGVAYLEGLGCDANVGLAEEHFDFVCNLNSRLGLLAKYYLARIRVEQSQTFAKERMLSLANQGNPFAQVFISRAFASGPVLRSYKDMKFNELGYFLKLAETGYGVSQVLAPLYGLLLVDEEKTLMAKQEIFGGISGKDLQILAIRSAETGNSIGKAVWESFCSSGMDFVINPNEYLLCGALCCLSNNLERAKFWFHVAGKDMGLAFINMLLETDPYAKTSWLTCMDCCYEDETANNIGFDVIYHKVVREKLLYSLLATGLDTVAVLDTIDFKIKHQSIEQVVDARCYMSNQNIGELMDLALKRYVKSVYGLRYLAGIYRQEGNLKAAMECSVAAAESEGGSEAIVDISMMFLERGDIVKAEVWGRKGDLASEMVVLGMVALYSSDVPQAIECFKVAAEANDPRAMWLLGEVLCSRKWLEKAASFGFSQAFDSLAEISKHENDAHEFWNYKSSEEYCKTSSRFAMRDAIADSQVAAAFRKWRSNL